MKKTKIIHIISSLARGGRERQLSTIYKYSDHERYITKIVVFNKTSRSYTDEYNINKQDLFYLRSKNFLKRVNEVIRIIKDQKPDIIYAWGGFEATFCFLAAPFTNGKVVNGSIRHGKVLFNSKQIWRLFLLHMSKYIVANSKAGLRANFLNRGFVLYNGIDEKFIVRSTIDKKKQIRKNMISGYSDQIILISVANLVPYKDYKTTINALSKLKQKGFKFHYYIIGDGPMRETILKQIKLLGLSNHIDLLGRINNVVDYLQMADIFIHSSKGEGCSNGILEAMASSLPIIATNTGGTSEISGIENGRLFEYRNTEQIVVALEELLSDEKLRLKMGEASFKKIQADFTISKMTSNYYQIISQIQK